MSVKTRLRNWLFEKASSVAPLISLQHLGQAVWTPRRYDKLADEGYKKNVIVYKCVQERMLAVQQAVWIVQRRGRDGEYAEVPDTDPLAKLLIRPNEFQGGAAFFGVLCGYDSLSGNIYIEAVKSSPGRPPMELHALRPDRMTVLAGDNGPAGWRYKVGSAEKKWKVAENVIRHIRQFNPTDDWYGMSPIEAAAFDVDIHNQALAWNKSLLDNGCKPSGALSYAPRNDSAPDFLPEDTFTRLQQQINEQYSGAANAGRPLLLEGGLDWVQFGLTPSDMDYINSKNTTARDIAMAFSVPPMLLGIPGDNTFSNLKEARFGFYEQWALPWLYNMRDELNAWLAPQFGEDYRITVDEDAIPALAPRREMVWDRVKGADFLSIEEKREAVGYPKEPKPGEQILVPATLIPLGTTPFADNPQPLRRDDDEDDA